MDMCSGLCGNCSKNCNEHLRHQLAMDGKLTYIYLKNGNKIAHRCMLHSQRIKVSNNNMMSIMSTIKAASKNNSGLVLSFPEF
jgi:hypothetical protein